MEFIAFDDRIYYCYLRREGKISQVVVYACSELCECDIRIYSFAENEDVKLPYGNWQYLIQQNELFLYAGKWLNISDKQITHQEGFHTRPPKCVFPCNREYVFDNRAISFPKPRTVICANQQTKETLWRHALKGYPYTTVENKGGCIIFGTSGKGGALYCINMETGEIQRDVSTKGTAHYCWYGNHIAMKDEYGHLQLVDPFSDKQIEV